MNALAVARDAHLGLGGVVWVVHVVVLAGNGGLDARGVEEAVQLLLLALSQAVDDAARLLLLLHGHTRTSVQRSDGGSREDKQDLGRESLLLTDRPYAFQALLEPHAYRLLGDLLFDGVLQLFSGQQLLQLQRLTDVHRAI